MEEKKYLLSISRNSDQKAFEWLYRKYAMKVFQFTYAILKSKEVAEEIVNDIFVKLWQQREQLEEIDFLQAYLLKAAKNRACNYLRLIKKDPRIDLNDITAEHIHFAPSPEELSLTRELSDHLSQAIEQLPPQSKLIFKLLKEDGLKYREVAILLNISVKTVESHMTLALRRIAEALEHYAHSLKTPI